jgi:hypothetical protein
MARGDEALAESAALVVVDDGPQPDTAATVATVTMRSAVNLNDDMWKALRETRPARNMVPGRNGAE